MGYQQALQLAWEDVERMGGSSLSFYFFNEEVLVHPRDRQILISGNMTPPNEYIQILFLHYLKNEHKVEEIKSDTWISFKDLDGGEIYYPVFRKRAIHPLLRKFKDDINQIYPHSQPLNVERFHKGNEGIILPVFPKIHVAIALWKGDDEFEPECSMLFNPSIKILLPTEDVAVLGGLVASRL